MLSPGTVGHLDWCPGVVRAMPMSLGDLHELIVRVVAWSLSFALTVIDVPAWTPSAVALLGITVFFANNFCNAMFGRTVLFPISVHPEDEENYELARVFSAAYSIVLWFMLVIAARWHAGGFDF